jgi:hypothetical protein
MISVPRCWYFSRLSSELSPSPPRRVRFRSEWKKRAGLLDDKLRQKEKWLKDMDATSTKAMMDCSTEEVGGAQRQDANCCFERTQRID